MSYNKKEWKKGDVIELTDLNNIENGIFELSKIIVKLEARIKKLETQLKSK